MGRVVRKKLTARAVEAAKPGRHYDDQGLVLVVSEKGAKRWVQRLQIVGKRCDIAIGPADRVSLAQARLIAADNLRIAHAGGDPRKPVTIVTFADAAQATLDKKAAELTNEKYLKMWRRSLTELVPEKLQAKPVGDWVLADVLACLTPVWVKTPATASALRNRIEAVMDWARAHQLRQDNPAQWRTLKPLLPSPSKLRKTQHHPAVQIAEAPAAFEALGDDLAGLCIRMIALTAARLDEIRGLRWDEITEEDGVTVLVIPAERMKTRVEHRIPLSSLARDILVAMPRIGPFVFGGHKPIGSVTLWRRMSGLGFADRQGRGATIHGWRSTFRDWGGRSREDRDLLELSLAHSLPAVEGAYARHELLELRLGVMERWAGHLTRKSNVVRLATA